MTLFYNADENQNNLRPVMAALLPIHARRGMANGRILVPDSDFIEATHFLDWDVFDTFHAGTQHFFITNKGICERLPPTTTISLPFRHKFVELAAAYSREELIMPKDAETEVRNFGFELLFRLDKALLELEEDEKGMSKKALKPSIVDDFDIAIEDPHNPDAFEKYMLNAFNLSVKFRTFLRKTHRDYDVLHTNFADNEKAHVVEEMAKNRAKGQELGIVMVSNDDKFRIRLEGIRKKYRDADIFVMTPDEFLESLKGVLRELRQEGLLRDNGEKEARLAEYQTLADAYFGAVTGQVNSRYQGFVTGKI